MSEEQIEQWKQKAGKWDKLCELVSKYYDTPNPNATRESDLMAIGEMASTAFGWLHLYESK